MNYIDYDNKKMTVERFFKEYGELKAKLNLRIKLITHCYKGLNSYSCSGKTIYLETLLELVKKGEIDRLGEFYYNDERDNRYLEFKVFKKGCVEKEQKLTFKRAFEESDFVEYYYEDSEEDDPSMIKQMSRMSFKYAYSQFSGTSSYGINFNKNKPIVFYVKDVYGNYKAWCKYENKKWVRL